MLTLLTIAGGVALILFAARFLRKGLDRLFGNRLEGLMQRMAHTRLRAFVAGVSVAVVAPSSTTVSILAVQTVNSGQLPPQRVLPIMLGADIGLTVLVMLIAMRLDLVAPAMIFMGVILYQFTSPTWSRGLGQIVLSLGFIFMGIATISQGAVGVVGNPDVAELLQIAARHPAALMLISVVLAVVLQSSTATIGLAMGVAGAMVSGTGPGGVVGLGQTDALTLAIPIVLGANVGMGITMLGLGWGQPDTRRLSLANLAFKVTTALILFFLITPVSNLVAGMNLTLDARIATLHTGFNLVKACLFLPLITPVFRLVSKVTPVPIGPSAFGPKYINNQRIDGVALALGQARQELNRVSAIVRSMLDDAWIALGDRNIKLAHAVQDRDDQVDELDTAIKHFLTRVVGHDADPQDSANVMAQLRYLNELESMGDIIDRNIAELAIKRAREAISFSEIGWSELDGFYRMVAENILIAETAFSTQNRLLARQLLRHKQKVNEEEHRLRDRHFERLRLGEARSLESSSVHLDIITHLKRLNSSVAHVAYTLLDESDKASD